MGTIISHHRSWFEVIWQGGVLLLLASVIALSVNQLRPGRLPLVADWSPEAQLKMDSGDSLMVSLDEAQALFFAQAAMILDARSQDVFAQGHIQGAQSLPWDEFDQHFDEIMARVPLDTPIVTYCDGESCGLSKELALALIGKGYTNVRVLVNGWTLWQENNLPIQMD